MPETKTTTPRKRSTARKAAAEKATKPLVKEPETVIKYIDFPDEKLTLYIEHSATHKSPFEARIIPSPMWLQKAEHTTDVVTYNAHIYYSSSRSALLEKVEQLKQQRISELETEIKHIKEFEVK